jgi:SAM-dependent methyltransferase
LYGNTVFWRSWDRSVGAATDVEPSLGVPVNTLMHPPELLLRCLTGQAAAPCTCSVLMRREVVEAIGGFEESFTHLFTDQAFYAKLFLASPVYVAAGTWDKYRIHERSAVMTAKRRGTLASGRRAYLEFVSDYLRTQRRDRGVLWRTVRRQVWLATHPRSASVLKRAAAHWRVRRRRLSETLPPPLRNRIRRLVRPIGGVRFGNLRRVHPFSDNFGCERGSAVDRVYVERFLQEHATDIAGHVLEIGDDAYTRQFGGRTVDTADVLDVRDGNPGATFVDDLASGHRLPSDTFDCIIVTQTLHLIYDVRAAVSTLHRILKPGGVVLMTAPGITPIARGKHTWWWSFTPASARRVFTEQFPESDVHVESYGNVLAATAFLYGVSREELRDRELAAHDMHYPVIVAVRARKPPRP